MPNLTSSNLHRYLQGYAVGLANAKSAHHLCERFGVSSRTIRGFLHELRMEGALIGSSVDGEHRGYFIPMDPSEAARGCGHLLSRVRQTAEVYEAQRAAIARCFPEQLSLFADQLPPTTQIAETVARTAAVPPSPARRGTEGEAAVAADSRQPSRGTGPSCRPQGPPVHGNAA